MRSISFPPCIFPKIHTSRSISFALTIFGIFVLVHLFVPHYSIRRSLTTFFFLRTCSIFSTDATTLYCLHRSTLELYERTTHSIHQLSTFQLKNNAPTHATNQPRIPTAPTSNPSATTSTTTSVLGSSTNRSSVRSVRYAPYYRHSWRSTGLRSPLRNHPPLPRPQTLVRMMIRSRLRQIFPRISRAVTRRTDWAICE